MVVFALALLMFGGMSIYAHACRFRWRNRQIDENGDFLIFLFERSKISHFRQRSIVTMFAIPRGVVC